MAGPCAVESREQLLETARCVKREGAALLRGGAFKPRTSPVRVPGPGLQALKLLAEAREATRPAGHQRGHRPGATCALFDEYVDMLQVGARNMQNFALLKAVGQSRKPVLLKRGLSSTIEEWLLAAEYILSAGNPNVILCERGIRTFETATRNTLDLSAVPVLRERTHLPVIVDPSTAPAIARSSRPMALAGRGRRGRRPHHRGPSGPAERAVGRRPVALASPSSATSWTTCAAWSSFGQAPAQPRSRQPRASAAGQRIDELRDQIDDVDARLAALVEERAPLAVAVQRRTRPDTARARRRAASASSSSEPPRGGTGPLTPDERRWSSPRSCGRRARRSAAMPQAEVRAAADDAVAATIGDVRGVAAREVTPAERAAGQARLPSDKSIAHRALIVDALAGGPADGRAPLVPARDVLEHARRCLRGTWACHGARPRTDAGARRRFGRASGLPTATRSWTAATRARRCGSWPARSRASRDASTLVGDASLRDGRWSGSRHRSAPMGAAVDDDRRTAPLSTVRGRVDRCRRSPTSCPSRAPRCSARVTLAALAADGPTRIETPGPTRDHTERMLGVAGRRRSAATAA